MASCGACAVVTRDPPLGEGGRGGLRVAPEESPEATAAEAITSDVCRVG